MSLENSNFRIQNLKLYFLTSISWTNKEKKNNKRNDYFVSRISKVLRKNFEFESKNLKIKLQLISN